MRSFGRPGALSPMRPPLYDRWRQEGICRVWENQDGMLCTLVYGAHHRGREVEYLEGS